MMVERERRPAAPQQQAAYAAPPVDMQLTSADRQALLEAVARVGSTENSARLLLQNIEYPLEELPGWAGNAPIAWWNLIFTDFDNGIIEEPYRRLVAALARRYQGNHVFRRLQADFAEEL